MTGEGLIIKVSLKPFFCCCLFLRRGCWRNGDYKLFRSHVQVKYFKIITKIIRQIIKLPDEQKVKWELKKTLSRENQNLKRWGEHKIKNK